MTNDPKNPHVYPHNWTEDCEYTGKTQVTQFGMTLRDHVAVTALPQVLLAWRGSRPYDFEDCAGDAENIADTCYRLADEFIKRREITTDMIKKIEQCKAFKRLEAFKQNILMKRDNRLKIEEQIVIARNAGVDAWQPPNDFPKPWAEIVKEVVTNELNK